MPLLPSSSRRKSLRSRVRAMKLSMPALRGRQPQWLAVISLLPGAVAAHAVDVRRVLVLYSNGRLVAANVDLEHGLSCALAERPSLRGGVERVSRADAVRRSFVRDDTDELSAREVCAAATGLDRRCRPESARVRASAPSRVIVRYCVSSIPRRAEESKMKMWPRAPGSRPPTGARDDSRRWSG